MNTFLPLYIILAMCISAKAEFWPNLDTYVDWSILIVLCETEQTDEGLRYRVKEEWKGVYSPELFQPKPKDGYLFTHLLPSLDEPKEGQLKVFFFKLGDDLGGGLLRHSTILDVRAGKIIYAPTSDQRKKEYPINDFRKAILDRVRVTFAADCKERIQAEKARRANKNN